MSSEIEEDGNPELGFSHEVLATPLRNQPQPTMENAAQNFTLLKDQNTPIDVVLMAWCPNMDLLALVTVDDKIDVRRLSWQQLLSIQVESPDGDTPEEEGEESGVVNKQCSITAIVWRPDGKVLAVGQKDGTISLYSVESKEKVLSTKPHEGVINVLEWIEVVTTTSDVTSNVAQSRIIADDYSFKSSDRTNRYFRCLPQRPTSADNESGPPIEDKSREISPAHDADVQAKLNFLMSADDDGQIHISAFGTSDIAHINTNELTALSFIKGKRSILSLRPSLNFSHFTTVIKCVDSGDVYVVTFDSNILNFRRHEIRFIASQHQHLGYLLSYVEDTILTMKQRWTTNQRPITMKFGALRSTLEDHALDTTPEEEFIALLLTGIPSTAVSQFFTKFFSSVALLKMQKTTESVIVRLLQILLRNLQKAIEEIVFRLTEYRALSHSKERNSCIGLDTTRITECLELASSLLLKSEELRKTFVNVRENFSAFFPWMIYNTQKINNEDSRPHYAPMFQVDKVVDAINFDLTRDRIGQYFNDKPLDDVVVVNPEFVVPGLKERWEKDMNLSLITLFNQFKENFEELFKSPVNSISQLIRPCISTHSTSTISSSSTTLPSITQPFSLSSQLITLLDSHKTITSSFPLPLSPPREKKLKSSSSSTSSSLPPTLSVFPSIHCLYLTRQIRSLPTALQLPSLANLKLNKKTPTRTPTRTPTTRSSPKISSSASSSRRSTPTSSPNPSTLSPSPQKKRKLLDERASSERKKREMKTDDDEDTEQERKPTAKTNLELNDTWKLATHCNEGKDGEQVHFVAFATRHQATGEPYVGIISFQTTPSLLTSSSTPPLSFLSFPLYSLSGSSSSSSSTISSSSSSLSSSNYRLASLFFNSTTSSSFVSIASVRFYDNQYLAVLVRYGGGSTARGSGKLLTPFVSPAVFKCLEERKRISEAIGIRRSSHGSSPELLHTPQHSQQQSSGSPQQQQSSSLSSSHHRRNSFGSSNLNDSMDVSNTPGNKNIHNKDEKYNTPLAEPKPKASPSSSSSSKPFYSKLFLINYQNLPFQYLSSNSFDPSLSSSLSPTSSSSVFPSLLSISELIGSYVENNNKDQKHGIINVTQENKDVEIKQRTLSQVQSAGLSLSGVRKVGSILSANAKRLLLFDLAEDEVVEEEGEGGGGEEEQKNEEVTEETEEKGPTNENYSTQTPQTKHSESRTDSIQTPGRQTPEQEMEIDQE